MEVSEWTIDLRQAMDTLSLREADIINALVVEGRAARDVASEVNLDISHAYRIRRKALTKLKKWLGNSEKEATSYVKGDNIISDQYYSGGT